MLGAAKLILRIISELICVVEKFGSLSASRRVSKI